MATNAKKRREDTDVDNFVLRVASATHTLCTANQKLSEAIHLIPLKIVHSNAAVTGGTPFSEAFCEVESESYDVEFLFGDVFHRGIGLVTEYLKRRTLPVNKKERLVLGKLLDFMKEAKPLGIDPNTVSETELTVCMANHLFGRLAITDTFIVDETYGIMEDQCFCDDPSCKITGQYGDTGIGNSEVWHGNVKVILNSDLIVEPFEEESVSSGEEKNEEMNMKSKTLTSENSCQLIPKTIVFSFLQKKRCPERDHFLTPCVGVGKSSLVVLFFDPEDDVLLESCNVPLFQTSALGKYEFDDTAILVSWLAVNYNSLSSGLTDKMKKCKGDFFMQAKSKIDIYKEKLQLGDIDQSLPVVNYQKTPLQMSSFLEEQGNKLVEIIRAQCSEK